jgi:hypothetical protein
MLRNNILYLNQFIVFVSLTIGTTEKLATIFADAFFATFFYHPLSIIYVMLLVFVGLYTSKIVGNYYCSRYNTTLNGESFQIHYTIALCFLFVLIPYGFYDGLTLFCYSWYFCLLLNNNATLSGLCYNIIVRLEEKFISYINK